jgi:uncharacterized membrane protein
MRYQHTRPRPAEQSRNLPTRRAPTGTGARALSGTVLAAVVVVAALTPSLLAATSLTVTALAALAGGPVLTYAAGLAVSLWFAVGRGGPGVPTRA